MNTIRISFAGILWLAACCQALAAAEGAAPEKKYAPMVKMADQKFNDWLTRWEKNITGDARNRYCDKAMGEDIGWLMTPFLDGFYYGYMATKDTKWVDMLVDWTDSWIKRGVKEPDGYLGWPKLGAAGTDVDKLDDFNADSLLGEAMVLRPVVLMAGEILKTPALKEKYGAKAESYLKLSEQIYEKWDKRGALARHQGRRHHQRGAAVRDRREDRQVDRRATTTRNAPGHGFSHPDNKANHVARWLLAMSDATGKPVYKERAEKWFRLMKSRMKLKADGTYEIWNYWQPAGPWDYKPDGSHQALGRRASQRRLLPASTSTASWTPTSTAWSSPGRTSTASSPPPSPRSATGTRLVPYSEDIQKKFEESMKPDSWSGLSAAPKYLMLQAELRGRH